MVDDMALENGEYTMEKQDAGYTGNPHEFEVTPVI